MSTDMAYTVKELASSSFSLTHGVYRQTEAGGRAAALCYSEAEAQQVADALNHCPAALAVVRKLHALNTSIHDWDEALRLDADIRRLTAQVLGIPLDSPAEKADDIPKD